MFPFFIFRLAAAASVTQNDVDHHPWSLYLKLSICDLNLAVSTVENLVGRVGGLCEALNGRKAHRLRSSGPIPACICCAGCGLSPEGSSGLEENVLTVAFSLGCFINIACSAAGFLMRFLSAKQAEARLQLQPSVDKTSKDGQQASCPIQSPHLRSCPFEV